MPDIAMCANPEKCPKAAACRRATATPTPKRQSYIAFYREGEECGDYWPVNVGTKGHVDHGVESNE